MLCISLHLISTAMTAEITIKRADNILRAADSSNSASAKAMKHDTTETGKSLAINYLSTPATVSEIKDTSVVKDLNLREITLSAGFITERNSPLRLTLIDQEKISRKSAGITYPEILGNIPGIFATSESGSYGDARINIRGFKQENISVLLNGIPISGLVTGNMFWNNWLGLTDATHSIQLQKGIGASMLSDNSVGGTINIITKTAAVSPGMSAGIFYTDYGQGKASLSLNTGELKGGWALSLSGSSAWGNGYVESTDVSSWAYMLNLRKRINEKNILLFTMLGSPETHEQRSVRLSYSETQIYGRRYSKNWGYRDGEPFNLSKNFYHKPYITLNHFYKQEGKSKLEIANTVYLAVGDGGGRWSESKGKRIIDYQKEGHIDWDAAIQANEDVLSGTSGAGENLSSSEYSALNILSNYLAGHTQAGFRHQTDYHLTDATSVQAGLHYQYYSTWEKEQITDLLGGEYWYEDYATKSLAGVAGRDPVKKVGDYIRTHNGKIIHHGTIYLSALHSNDHWNLRGGASILYNNYQRWDKYNYVDNPASSARGIYSGLASAAGFSIKGGVLYKPGKCSSYYLNAAIYSRLPYSDLFFSSGTNQITSNVKNEKNLLAEIGYRYISGRATLEINGYWAYWKNKTLISDPYKQLDDITYRYMVQGLDALHQGIELTVTYSPFYWLDLEGNTSLGDWHWENDVEANIYDEYSGMLADQVKVYSDGLPVGDAPQTQVGASAFVRFSQGLNMTLEWRYNDRLYADFDPTLRNDPDDRAHSLKLPSYNLVNLGMSWKKKWGMGETTLFMNINNILDETYIERGKDGSDHTMDSFRGYWGFGINGTVGVRLTL
jgi:hypothetical protein